MSDNENKINENSVENFDDSNMNNFETHSTPSASQNATEISETESRIMDEGIHSTPILGNQDKKPDNDTMLARLYLSLIHI